MDKPIPIMGPDCKDPALAHCPPASHFELTEAELMDLIRDPKTTARRLGLKDGIQSVLIAAPDDNAPIERATYCCIDCLTSSICCKAWPQTLPL